MRIFEGWAENILIMAVVSDLDNANTIILYSDMKTYLSKYILRPRIILLGIIRVLEAGHHPKYFLNGT